MFKYILLFLAILNSYTFFSCVYAQDIESLQVESFNNLEVTPFNLKINKAKKSRQTWIKDPLSILLNIYTFSTEKYVNITLKSDRNECPLNSIITVKEDGILDDQIRGKWTQFYFYREGCSDIWQIREIREAYLCGLPSSQKAFTKDLCFSSQTDLKLKVEVIVTPKRVKIPCDAFPYTLNVEFIFTVNKPSEISFQRLKSSGEIAPEESIEFLKAGSRIFEDYYRVSAPGTYWFGVKVLKPKKALAKDLAYVSCY